jgi:hypothetical protein
MTNALARPDPAVETILRHFANTAPTEEAFYVRFQTLACADLATLRRAWAVSDNWAVFRRIWRRLGRPRARQREAARG